MEIDLMVLQHFTNSNNHKSFTGSALAGSPFVCRCWPRRSPLRRATSEWRRLGARETAALWPSSVRCGKWRKDSMLSCSWRLVFLFFFFFLVARAICVSSYCKSYFSSAFPGGCSPTHARRC